MTKHLLLFCAFCLCLSAFAPAEDAALPDPEKPGPYPAGVTTMTFVDASRQDPATGGPRTLPTEIWYPATEDTRGLPPNKLSDFLLRNQSPELALLLYAGFGVDLAEADRTFQNFAVRDARIRDGLYPLILFSHGNGGLRMQNAFWCEHLASHGYIVMAPDHTGNCAVTFAAGVPVPMQQGAEARDRSAADRPKDLSFLIDQMTLMAKGNDSRFHGRVDLDRIAAAGHSFGGFTSFWVSDAEPRVKAILPMAGAAPEWKRTDIPLMLFIATEDDTLGLDRMGHLRNVWAKAAGPRYLVEFRNGGHFSFTEMHQLKPGFGDGVGAGKRITNGEPLTYVAREVVFPLVNGYSTAFLGKHLKGQEGYAAYLAENHHPAELDYEPVP